MIKIYIVMSLVKTDEYSYEKSIKAYIDKALAENHVKNAQTCINKIYKKLGLNLDSNFIDIKRQWIKVDLNELDNIKNKWDKDCSLPYGASIRYYIYKNVIEVDTRTL